MKFCKGSSDRDSAEDFVIRKHQGPREKVIIPKDNYFSYWSLTKFCHNF